MIAAGWLIPAVLLAVLLTLVGCVLASGAMHREDTARLDAARTGLARTSGMLWGLADSALLDPVLTSAVEAEARAADVTLGLAGRPGPPLEPAWDGRHVRVLP